MTASELKKLIGEVVQQVLSEHVMNSSNPEEKRLYVSEVVPLVLSSYKYVGGYKGATTEEDTEKAVLELANDDSMWKMSRRNGKIVAIVVAEKTPFGLKRILSASTGRNKTTPTKGLSDLISIVRDDVRLKRTYAEVSGRVEVLMLRAGAHKVKADEVGEFLPGKEIELIAGDEYHYKRKIRGTLVTKLMIGFPTKQKNGIESALKKLK